MKKLLVVLLAFVMLIGTTSPAAAVNTALPAPSFKATHGFDLGIANDERLIQMLKNEGVIDEDAAPAEAEEALMQYLKAKAENAGKKEGELDKQAKKIQSQIAEKLYNHGMYSGKGKKFGQTKGTVKPVKEETWNGSVTTDKVLVVLIDYPDFENSNIEAEETDMYYDNYPKEHYENMIFGEDGYEGPNGENLISMKQYYEAQSGGSYTIEGQVAGWYTAKESAAHYGGNVPAPDGSDDNPRDLVMEALEAVAADESIDLGDFDQEDRYDLDGDGDLREADGLIDHLMVIHAGVGEEAGGGSLGGDAIWSHRSNLGGVFAMEGTEAEVDYWDGLMGAYDYTIEPEDGATGVFAHEYGHDLGLPDEYDTVYSGMGEAVAYWSIMSSGSWAGKIGGAEPTGFSPYAKEYLQASLGGNWQKGVEVDIEEIDENGIEVLLDQASSKGTNPDVLRINLPEKEVVVNEPAAGEFEYFSGSGDELNNSMVTTVDLTKAAKAMLTFKTWYQIEEDWDYASVQVKEDGKWVSIPGNITTDSDPHEQNPGFGITGHSDGWVDAEFDLSDYAGQEIDLRLNYWTDVAAAEAGFYVDEINIIADGDVVLYDGAEDESEFTLKGFKKDSGKFRAEHYYLIEWRNHKGVDRGLKHIARGASLMEYDPGMVVWYIDNSYSNNWVGNHPGDGYLGVVDADQHTLDWSDKELGSSRYQMHDAAFSLEKGNKMYLDYGSFSMTDNYVKAFMLFDDGEQYIDEDAPDFGRNIPNFGLKIRVTGESSDRSVAKIFLFK